MRVNKDALGEDDADQWNAALAVDDNGVVHVIFYDDRNYTQSDTVNCAAPGYKYDVYYCRSTDHGVTFAETGISRIISSAGPGPIGGGGGGTPPDPAFDATLVPPTSGFQYEPGDYVQLVTRKESNKVHVYMVYAGTSDEEPAGQHASVIWFSLSVQ